MYAEGHGASTPHSGDWRQSIRDRFCKPCHQHARPCYRNLAIIFLEECHLCSLIVRFYLKTESKISATFCCNETVRKTNKAELLQREPLRLNKNRIRTQKLLHTSQWRLKLRRNDKEQTTNINYRSDDHNMKMSLYRQRHLVFGAARNWCPAATATAFPRF